MVTCLATCAVFAYWSSSLKSSASKGSKPSKRVTLPFVTIAGSPAASPSPLLASIATKIVLVQHVEGRPRAV